LIDLYRALVFFNEGRLFEARRNCKEALESFQALGLVSKAVLAHLLLARIALQTDSPDEASRHASAALEAIPGLDSPVLTYQTHLLWGNLSSVRGDREKAYA